MTQMQDSEVPFEDFAGTADFPVARVKQWADRVVELRWGSDKDFRGRGLKRASPYFFRRPVGTGVRLDNGLVLTCAHVFSPPSSVTFPMVGNRKAWFRETVKAMRVLFGHRSGDRGVREYLIEHVSYWGSKVDAAFVEFAGSAAVRARAGGHPVKETADAATGDPICILHHAGGGPLAVSIGKVTAVDPAGLWFRHDAPTRGGVSGAPVFRRDGRLLGIHRGVYGVLGTHAAAVPIGVIRDFTSADLDPRQPGRRLRAQKGKRWILPARPERKQEIDVGSFDVFNRDPADNPRVAFCWVPDDGQHEAWAMIDGEFADAGSTPEDDLLFDEYLVGGAPRDWWMDFGGQYPSEPSWNAPATWLSNWRAWTAEHLGVPQSGIDYVYHSRYSYPQP